MDYTSTDFKVQYISNYSLYISSDYHNDQLVILDEDNRVLLVRSYDAQNPDQDVAKILSLPFPKVYITLSHQELLWVPTEVFRESEMSDFAPFFDNTENIASTEFDTLAVTALYQYDLLLHGRWKKIFGDAKFVPVFEVTLQQVQPQIPIRGAVLGVYMYDRQMDLFLFVDGAFKFYNTFEVATVDDMSYFVLQLFHNYGISGKVGKILLGGADLQSSWGKRLAVYSENLERIKSKRHWLLDSEIATVDIDRSSFGLLADLELCV